MTASSVPAAALVQAFFVEYLLNQKKCQPKNTRRLSRRVSFALAICPRDEGRRAGKSQCYRSRCAHYPGFPRQYRTAASQLYPFAKCAAGGHTFLLPIRPDAGTGRSGGRIARAGDPGQAHGAQARLPHAFRNRCDSLRYRSDQLGGPPRPCAASHAVQQRLEIGHFKG